MQTQVLMSYYIKKTYLYNKVYDEEKCIDILILFTITKRQCVWKKAIKVCTNKIVCSAPRLLKTAFYKGKCASISCGFFTNYMYDLMRSKFTIGIDCVSC